MVGGSRIATRVASIALAGIALVGIVAATTSAAAQEVTANIEPRLVPVGGLAELTIEIDSGAVTGKIDEPTLPELPAQAAVVGRARESRVEMSGLDVRQRTVFRYTLRGLEPGTVRIGPIAVRVGDEIRRTEPLIMLVVGDAGPPGADRAAGDTPPIFVAARVDRDRAWTGQQVTLTFSFYHDPSTPLAESPDYDPPETAGFWRVELSDAPDISSERIGDRSYQVQRFRYALFPLQAGTAEIGPARVRVVQPAPDRWWEPGRPRVLETDPLVVTVDELPAGAPLGFTGTVGRYSISGGLPAAQATAGSPIELALTVRGSGNPATVGAPELPDWPGIDVGVPRVETDSEVDGLRLGGRATFRWILVPSARGSVDLGTARLPYFDPDLGAYAVDTLRLGELHVSQGPVASAPGGSGAPRDPKLWEARDPRGPWPRGLAGKPLYWAALAGPWLAWLALGAWSRRPRRLAGAERSAAAIVAAARRELEEGGRGLAPETARAVERALEVRYGATLAGLAPREREERLRSRGAPAEVVASAEAARAALEGVRFGGVGVEVAARELDRLESTLRGGAGRGASAPGTALLALALGLAGPASASGSQTSPGEPPSPAMTTWREANRAYSAGDLGLAIRGYEGLAASYDDPHLQADLAAALWRRGRRGEALARYRSALALAPRDVAMRSDERRLWDELGRPARSGPMARALALARLDELLMALLVASWLGVGAVAVTRARRSARPVAITAVTAVVALAIVAALHAWVIERPELGVATAGAEVRATPGGKAIASLPEGAVVRILERSGEGWRVRSTGQPSGWVALDRIVSLD